MKAIKYYFHYFFGKHQWEFKYRFYKDKYGKEVDTEYGFECKKCHKQKNVKIG